METIKPVDGAIYHASSPSGERYIVKYIKEGNSYYIWTSDEKVVDGIRKEIDEAKYCTRWIESKFLLSEPQPWEVELIEASIKAGNFVNTYSHTFQDNYSIF